MLESQSPAPARVRESRSKVPQSDVITLRTDPRHFESFLRSIARYDSLLDVRRLKNDVVGEIRRTRALLGELLYLGISESVSHSQQRNTRTKTG